MGIFENFNFGDTLSLGNGGNFMFNLGDFENDASPGESGK